MKIEKLQVYNLLNAIAASKYPMAVDTSKCDAKITPKVLELGKQPRGSAHDNFLNGIIVTFDLTFSIKAWIEWERYHFQEIISSQSTMHRIAKFEIKKCVNSYVTPATIAEVNRLKDEYNANPTPENYLRLLYNVPVGFELTAHIVTSYGQLKTMLNQRHDHRLPEWREFCRIILGLQFFTELTGLGEKAWAQELIHS